MIRWLRTWLAAVRKKLRRRRRRRPYAATWYVSAQSGNDLNSGLLPNEPVKSLSKAIALADGVGKRRQCIILACHGEGLMIPEEEEKST